MALLQATCLHFNPRLWHDTSKFSWRCCNTRVVENTKLGSLNRVWQKTLPQPTKSSVLMHGVTAWMTSGSRTLCISWTETMLFFPRQLATPVPLYHDTQLPKGINTGLKCSHTTTLSSLKIPDSPELPGITQLEISPGKLTLPISFK